MFKTNKKYQSKGFTLVELAIVLLVIGILAGLLVRNYGGFTGAARDTRVLADLRNVSVMLAAYFSKVGNFPMSTYAGASASWTQDFAGELERVGIITNARELPNHPFSGKFYRYYSCDRDGTGTVYGTGSAYILVAELESPTSNIQVYSGSATSGQNIRCLMTNNSNWDNRAPNTIGCYPSTTLYCLYNY